MVPADDLLVIVDDHPTARQCVPQSGVAHPLSSMFRQTDGQAEVA
jgi:hypothetical protein